MIISVRNNSKTCVIHLHTLLEHIRIILINFTHLFYLYCNDIDISDISISKK